MTATEWLTDQTYKTKEGETRLQQMARLIAYNGFQLEVHGWGVTTHGVGIYDREGLELEEALGLIEGSAYLQGMLRAHGQTIADVTPLFDEEWNRVRAEQEQKAR